MENLLSIISCRPADFLTGTNLVRIASDTFIEESLLILLHLRAMGDAPLMIHQPSFI